jgi:predicted ATP-dependent endonuclease of OLD family
MTLSTITLHGYRCWLNTTINMADYTSLIGRNDSGKSALLRALAFLFDPDRSWATNDLCKFEKDLDPKECYVEASFHDCHVDFPLAQGSTARIRRYQDGHYEVDGQQPLNESVRNLQSRVAKSVFRDEVGEDSALWKNLPSELREKRTWSAADGIVAFEALRDQGLVETTVGPESVNADKVRACFLPIFLDADARIAEAAGGTSSIFSQLAGKVTEVALRQDQVVQESFEKLQTRVNELSAIDEDGKPIFSELEKIQTNLSALIAEFNPRVKAEVRPTPGQIPFPRVSSVLTIKDDWTENMGQFGHGLQRTVIFALLKVLYEQRKAAGSGALWNPFTILLIEEPELYLHPQAERDRMAELESFATQDDAAVIIATHSAFFIDILKHEGIKIVERENGIASTVCQWDTSKALADDEREELQIVKAFNPSVAALFFADKILLVEGQTEEVSVPLVFKKLGLPTSGLQVVDCQGASKIRILQEVLEGFGKAYTAMFDWDKSKDEARKGFEISKKGIGHCVILVPNWEGVAGISGPSSEKIFRSYKKFSDATTTIPPKLAAAMTAVDNNGDHIPPGTALIKEAKKKGIENFFEKLHDSQEIQ